MPGAADNTLKDYAVIFDMDGVLVDSYRAHYESWRRMLGERGITFTEQQFAGTFGRTSREIIRHFWADRVANDEIAAWDADKEAAYRDIIAADFPEMDGAHELIDALHAAGFVMAIGSSGPPENVQVVLDHLPSGRLITAKVDAFDVTHGKPHPEVFLKAAGKLGVEPPRCAVVEDAPAGVEAARRAGMTPIALTGTAPRETLAPGAAVVVDSLRELAADIVRDLIDSR